MENLEKSVVAIARTKEKHRSPERVLTLVREAIDLLGGMSKFVRAGDTVLIKPNQTVYYSAEEGCTNRPACGRRVNTARKRSGRGSRSSG